MQARLDDGAYPTGVKAGHAQLAALPISRHSFHGDWNYTLHPATMRRALAEVRDLLDQHGHHIEPVTAPPGPPVRIPPYIPQTTGNAGDEIKTAC